MICRNLFRFSHRRHYRLLVQIVIFTALIIAGCREKDYPKSPTNVEPGEYTLVLPGPLVMYRDSASGNVLNDTIIVRMYGTDGNLKSGVTIRSQALVSVGRVSASVVSSADTISFPYGSATPLIYWGNGGTEGHETVTSWAVWNGDTVATTSLSFKVLDP